MIKGRNEDVAPHIMELIRTYRLLKMGITISEDRLSRWEEDALIVVDDQVETWKTGKSKTTLDTNKDQGIGEYCEGADIAECKKIFGDALNQACKACPD